MTDSRPILPEDDALAEAVIRLNLALFRIAETGLPATIRGEEVCAGTVCFVAYRVEEKTKRIRRKAA